MLDAEGYLDLLMALQPPGAALPRDPGTVWGALLAAEAEELARVDARAADLLNEADPRTATELLPDWERICGLPGPCVAAAPTTLAARRRAVHTHLTARYGQRPADHEALAEALGYVGARVEEFRPFRAGLSRAGDPLSNGDWAHAFLLRTADVVTIRPFTAGGSCAAEPLAEWGDALLECELRRRAQAHLIVLFAYGPKEE